MKARALPALIAALLSATQTQAEGLMNVYERAVSHDSQLAAARASREASKAAVTQSRATLLPQVTAFGETSRNNRNDIEPTLDSYQAGIRLTQPLFRASSWFSFQASQTLDSRAQAQLSLAQQQLMLDVAERYIAVLRAEDELDTAHAQEAALQKQWQQAKERYDVGLVATTEVEEARAGYDDSKSQRIAAQSQLDIAKQELAQIAGRYYDDLHRLSSDFPIAKPEPANPNAWKKQATQQNWDIKVAELALEATREEVSVARSQHLPTLDLSAEVIRGSSEGAASDFGIGGGTFTSSQTDRRVTLSLEMPLFESGATVGAVNEARSEAERAKWDLQTRRRSVRLEAGSLYRRITTNIESLRAQRQTLVSRRSALDATRAGYEVGTRNIVEVLDAEQNYYVALRDYANARYDYVLNTLRLKQTAGTLSPQDLAGLDRWLSATAPGIERLARQVTREEQENSGD